MSRCSSTYLLGAWGPRELEGLLRTNTNLKYYYHIVCVVPEAGLQRLEGVHSKLELRGFQVQVQVVHYNVVHTCGQLERHDASY